MDRGAEDDLPIVGHKLNQPEPARDPVAYREGEAAAGGERSGGDSGRSWWLQGLVGLAGGPAAWAVELGDEARRVVFLLAPRNAALDPGDEQ
ncbi:MAG: hypothetical protein EBZ36_17210, partial [Acidobacteria bacterium]|nr:hypothetical protein [Acidobacteriota bacterium]